MTYLLDTHVLLWFRVEPAKLGPQALALLADPTTPVAVSSVSTLETTQLVFSGRILLPTDAETWMRQTRKLFQATEIELDSRIAAEAYRLPEPFHKDPADRMLVATARCQGYPLVTVDRRILEYPHVPTFDARN